MSFWFSYRGLEPHLDCAHAGHTQGAADQLPARAGSKTCRTASCQPGSSSVLSAGSDHRNDVRPHSRTTTMKPRFVADGESRLRSSPEFRARLRELRECIRARHAAELAHARFFQRLVLHWRIAREFRRERQKIEPSPSSLYSSQIVARKLE